uniref:Secreted protein n=1 Tax=Rhipicephalus zambeziensis TaxID=60191 RepID=A0A224YBS8_9ACAR
MHADAQHLTILLSFSWCPLPSSQGWLVASKHEHAVNSVLATALVGLPPINVVPPGESGSAEPRAAVSLLHAFTTWHLQKWHRSYEQDCWTSAVCDILIACFLFITSRLTTMNVGRVRTYEANMPSEFPGEQGELHYRPTGVPLQVFRRTLLFFDVVRTHRKAVHGFQT